MTILWPKLIEIDNVKIPQKRLNAILSDAFAHITKK